MTSMKVERDVTASPERVWSIISDLDRSAEVISAIESIERLDGASGFGVGTVLAVTLGPKLAGVTVLPMWMLAAWAILISTGIALLASYFPARRAARLHPVDPRVGHLDDQNRVRIKIGQPARVLAVERRAASRDGHDVGTQPARRVPAPRQTIEDRVRLRELPIRRIVPRLVEVDIHHQGFEKRE